MRFLQRAGRRRKAPRGEVGGALVGSLVLNRFLIERRIGSGGFGVVYEAWDGRLERTVAVKAIESRGETGRRVLREAQAVARLNHRGIVTLYEMGEEDGNALLVTEMVEGPTLAELSAADTLSDREIGEVGADLCEALDHAHSRGVVHRDVKPQNVLVCEGDEPRAKLMDFGVARVADAAALTAPGDVVGTLAYMAPEQAEGRAAGPETDVYSLALTLYECWSGDNPNRRATPAATARAIGARPRPLRRLRRDLPQELSETIDAALSRRPNRRPALEELGTTIEESLELLADRPPGFSPPLGLRAGALVAAALLGAWLAAGHGLALP
jgi:serine/threonine protein kinase